jgi:hypothetical protein
MIQFWFTSSKIDKLTPHTLALFPLIYFYSYFYSSVLTNIEIGLPEQNTSITESNPKKINTGATRSLKLFALPKLLFMYLTVQRV